MHTGNLPDGGVQNRRLRAGIVGGGRGSFIGAIHRIAAEMDGQATVVAGAMSADEALAKESAEAWYLERSYGKFAEMARAEAVRADGIDFVIVATPNHLHVPVATAFLQSGIHVVCDKPLAHQLGEAEDLVRTVERSGKIFALTHNYTGYPAVREARERVASGELGDLRKVIVEYSQDWLMSPEELTGNRQAVWRTDPGRAGVSCCLADIGTHAQNLLEFVACREVTAVCADVTSFVPGRMLDDDANVLIHLQGGAKGVLTCSQVACGEENNLNLRLYGTEAALEWHQEEPNTLLVKRERAPWERVRMGAGSSVASRGLSRLPAGHPEGYLEAFANLYRLFIDDVKRARRGEALSGGYPTVYEGLRGMRFVRSALESSRQGGRWVDV
jgi:predicted dehydrogenase